MKTTLMLYRKLKNKRWIIISFHGMRSSSGYSVVWADVCRVRGTGTRLKYYVHQLWHFSWTSLETKAIFTTLILIIQMI